METISVNNFSLVPFTIRKVKTLKITYLLDLTPGHFLSDYTASKRKDSNRYSDRVRTTDVVQHIADQQTVTNSCGMDRQMLSHSSGQTNIPFSRHISTGTPRSSTPLQLGKLLPKVRRAPSFQLDHLCHTCLLPTSTDHAAKLS